MTDSHKKLLYRIALTNIKWVGNITARNLLSAVEDEERLFSFSRKELMKINGVSARLADEITNPEVLRRSEAELRFVEKNDIKTFFITDDEYPFRLRECADAPILLYHKGNVNLNADKVISIVGTRHATDYGLNYCDTFLKELSAIFPDLLVVSGLAYGIDIQAHRCALKYNLSTVAVLAHGLDRIYPHVHRGTAVEMLNNGGILSDYPSGTEPERYNFVGRNRIVAGLADAVIVIESGEKGGSLITADLDNSYCKDVFATPGRVSDRGSVGCNKLIANHKADLLQSTDYFIQQMGWGKTNNAKKKEPKQQELFAAQLNDEEQKVVNVLKKQGNMHIDLLAHEVSMPVYQLLSILLEMELKGIVRNIPGNVVTLG